ncbi:hypothetical protein ABXS75_03660 [Roseburia hominis]
MKKNKMLRMASALMVLTLLTTSIIGGTFAKYTTTGNESDNARVAKWGVTINVESDLFATAYKDEKVDDNAATATVKSSDTTQLVAPGTKGTGLDITHGSGTPEVSYNMTIKLNPATAKMPTLKYAPNGGSEADYEPVKFSVYNGENVLVEDKTLEQLKALFDGFKIIYTYDVGAQKYYVDKDIDGTISDSEKTTASDDLPDIKIKWEWAYEDNANQTLNDKLDTVLGNAAATTPIPTEAEYDGGKATQINTEVKLDWTVTATQID